MSRAARSAASTYAGEVIAKRAGSGATGIANAAQRTYDDLAHVSVPLIGSVGVDAVIGRALYLAREQYPWLRPDGPDSEERGSAFDQAVRALREAEPAAAADAAAAVFAFTAGLLATLIGEGLTASLLYRAWPDAFPTPSKLVAVPTPNNEEQ